MQELSERTWQIIQKMFSPEEHDEAGRFLVAECGNNLPFFGNLDEHGLERVRFAVLKLSNGNFDALLRAIEGAQIDWRDTFMAAGLGCDAMEHEHWANRYLAQG
jgi:hypothetical protein